MIRSYRKAKQKERDYNLYWKAKGYYVRPHSVPFLFRWIGGFTRELSEENQSELNRNRRKFELELQSRHH